MTDPDTNDIVWRLQQSRWHGTPFSKDARDAADEILRLRAAACLPGRFCPEGHVLLPQSNQEAEMMHIIAERFLFPERFIKAPLPNGVEDTPEIRERMQKALAASPTDGMPPEQLTKSQRPEGT